MVSPRKLREVKVRRWLAPESFIRLKRDGYHRAFRAGREGVSSDISVNLNSVLILTGPRELFVKLRDHVDSSLAVLDVRRFSPRQSAIGPDWLAVKTFLFAQAFQSNLALCLKKGGVSVYGLLNVDECIWTTKWLGEGGR